MVRSTTTEMGTVEEMVAALQGLADEKRVKPSDVIKDFNLFLNQKSQDVSDNVSRILEAFAPETRLGKLLRLKMIHRYKVSTSVWPLLQSDDSLAIKHAMKFDWFFADVDHSTLLQAIPNVSLSTRSKIINRYGRCLENVAAGESIYKALKSRYGIKNAIPLLPACGEEFIKNEVANLTVLLPPSVLLMLFDKHQSIAIEYIKFLISDEHRKVAKLQPYVKVFVQLSRKDAIRFFELYDRHHTRFPSMILGRRPLKKAITNHFDRISKCYGTFERIIDEKQFFHRLSLEQFKLLYVSCILPPNSSKFFTDYKSYSVLSYVKTSLVSDVMTSSFKMKYEKDCLSKDVLHKFSITSLEYLPIEARIDWVSLKVPEMDYVPNQVEAIAYLPVEMSLPQLKTLITSQSDATIRAAVAEQMVRTLKINQSSPDIKHVVDFLVKRFRNETKGFRQVVLCEMGLLGDLFLKMDWEDWSSIHDLIDIVKLNNELRFCSSALRAVYKQQIHQCFLKKLDVDPHMRGYVDFELMANDFISSLMTEIGKGTPYHKQCIEWFLEELPTLKIKLDEEQFSSMVLNVMDTLVDYNSNNKRSKIDLPEWTVNELERILCSESATECQVLNTLKLLEKNKDFELCDRVLLKQFPKYYNFTVICRLLMKYPNVILDHLEFLINKVLSSFPSCYYSRLQLQKYRCFVRKFRLYDDIRVQMINKCFTAINQAVQTGENLEQIKLKTNAIEMLVELMGPSSYLEFCMLHAPVRVKSGKSKDVSTDQVGATALAVQQAISKSLKRVLSPLNALTVLRRFVGCNNRRIVCSSLFSVCTRIPESVILPILGDWTERSVSLQKQILRAIHNIAPTDYSVTMFVKLFGSETNPFVRLILFRQIRDRFIEEPTDESYGIFASLVQQLGEDDTETLNELFDVQNVGDAYLSQYIELTWRSIDSKWMNFLPHGKSKIVERVDGKVIKLLSDDLCDLLLQYDILKLPKPLSKYVCLYLLYSHDDDVEGHRLGTVMSALKPHILSLWNECKPTSSGHVFVIRHSINNFVQLLCAESVKTHDSMRAASVLSKTKEELLKLIQLDDILQECVQLDAYSIYLKVKSSRNESTFPSALAELYSNYIVKHDSNLKYAIFRHLTFDIPMVSNAELALELLQNHTHPTCHVLAASLMNYVSTTNLSLQHTIIEILSRSSHPHVQVAASDYFRSLKITS